MKLVNYIYLRFIFLESACQPWDRRVNWWGSWFSEEKEFFSMSIWYNQGLFIVDIDNTKDRKIPKKTNNQSKVPLIDEYL